MRCEHCGSTNGHWSSKNIWLCSDCNKITIYYEVTELGKQAVKELLTESVASDSNKKDLQEDGSYETEWDEERGKYR